MPAQPASRQILYVSGLPRAGSTLLCQLLDQHPHIDSPGHSSPLWNALNHVRETLSDDSFWLAQLDVDFARNYARLLGLPRHVFDPNALPVRPHESDSYYRFKYPHTTHRTIRPPTEHQVSSRIVAEIHKNCLGFYAQFYPEQPWLQESAS